MGCGASNDAKPVPVVPEPNAARDPNKPHRVNVAAMQRLSTPQSAQQPPGSASLRNGLHTPLQGLASRRGSGLGGMLDEELPPLKGTPKQRGSTLSPSLAPPSLGMDSAPPGSQTPGVNYCDPEFFTAHMEQCWYHYAKPPSHTLIDKSGAKQMGEDCVHSFLDAARKWITTDNPKWKPEKVEAKLQKMRMQFMPGTKLEDCITIGTHFMVQELKFGPSEEPGRVGISKPCFFLHFQRAHRALFSFPPKGAMTLERELLVQKLNKLGADRASRGFRSLTAGHGGGSGLSSSKAMRSVKASSRHKDKAKRSEKRTNMFGSLDFGEATVAEHAGEKESSTSKRQ